MTARYTVIFHGDAPDDLRVGDQVDVSGSATVRSITAELVDVTAGSGPQFTLGEVTIALVANRLKVEA